MKYPITKEEKQVIRGMMKIKHLLVKSKFFMID
jgi:CBS domain containing-hemolysin-like protein